ncbi:MerR family transcriptional regulator [Marinobacterium arenosum]|uniref:MerR family transcriptional regulator n=1 Tax=Marinobacterium arenosum TaxID=2862496 RepID=UPI001C949D96|nr:MerR family transcriptional regulator [Marinobacterium arenosum]MBY4677640.1 MerR family transcriptional regulator [Marinobacterium arenosum]
MRKLTISAVAKQAGVGVETIRYYQRIGLLAEPVKPAAGYRTYSQRDIRQIHFIQRAKQLGFSLKEIKVLLSLEQGDCDRTRQLATHKLADVQNKIRDLKAIATTLEQLITSCERNESGSSCPIIDAISDKP